MKKQEIIKIIEEREANRKKWKPELWLSDTYEYLISPDFNIKSIEYLDETILKANNKTKYYLMIVPIVILLLLVFVDDQGIIKIIDGFFNGEGGSVFAALVMGSIFFIIPIYYSFKKYHNWVITKKGFKYGKKEVFFSDVEYICYRVLTNNGNTKGLSVFLKNGAEIKFGLNRQKRGYF